MKTLSVNLFDKNSVDKAVDEIKKMQRDYPRVQKRFLELCYEKFKELANQYLETNGAGINPAILVEIKTAWDKIIEDGNLKIVNTDETRSAAVEFGFGAVGALDPHPNAASAEPVYEYNVPSKGKHKAITKAKNPEPMTMYLDDWWELPKTHEVMSEYTEKSSDGSLVTRGQPAVMYAYNALLDLKEGWLDKLYAQAANEVYG